MPLTKEQITAYRDEVLVPEKESIENAHLERLAAIPEQVAAYEKQLRDSADLTREAQLKPLEAKLDVIDYLLKKEGTA